MSRMKLHNLEESSILFTSSLRLTENDVAELYRILTSWFDLTRTDIGRKAMEINESFMLQEREILTEIEQNPFISTSLNSEKDEQNA